MLPRLGFDSNFQMEVQGCACGEAAHSSSKLKEHAVGRRMLGERGSLVPCPARVESISDTKGATQKHSAKKLV